MKTAYKWLLVGVLISIAVFYFVFVSPSPQQRALSLSDNLVGYIYREGTPITGWTTQISDLEGTNLQKGEWYEFLYKLSWREAGRSDDDPTIKATEIQNHLKQVTKELWQELLEDYDFLEYMYRQYTSSKIKYCSNFIQESVEASVGVGYYDVRAEIRIQVVCIKNPMPIIVAVLIIVAIIGVCAVLLLLPNVLHELSNLLHGWEPPAPPSPPPEDAPYEVWKAYYDAYNLAIEARSAYTLWYVVLIVIGVMGIMVAGFFLFTRRGRAIVKRGVETTRRSARKVTQVTEIPYIFQLVKP